MPDIGPDEKILFRPKIAMLAHEGATKIARMTEAWAPWGFKPDLVIIERQPEVSFRRKLGQLIGEGGFSGDPKKVIFCVITRLEEAKLKDIVNHFDENAFLAVGNIHDVKGGRFNKKAIH